MRSRAALDALRSNRLADLHAHQLDDFFVGVFGAVGKLNGLELGTRPRLYGHDHVHFVGVVMRHGFHLHFAWYRPSS